MPVQTRSMKRLMENILPMSLPQIDFNAASKEWRKNKIAGPNGTFKYRPDADKKRG